jgi:hypothetical protein
VPEHEFAVDDLGSHGDALFRRPLFEVPQDALQRADQGLVDLVGDEFDGPRPLLTAGEGLHRGAQEDAGA